MLDYFPTLLRDGALPDWERFFETPRGETVRGLLRGVDLDDSDFSPLLSSLSRGDKPGRPCGSDFAALSGLSKRLAALALEFLLGSSQPFIS